MSAAPNNRRRPLLEVRRERGEAEGHRSARDRAADDDSPLPGPATTTVLAPAEGRPRARSPSRRASASRNTLQMIGGAPLPCSSASIGVAYGARRYITIEPSLRGPHGAGRRRPPALGPPSRCASSGGLEVGKNIFTLDLELAGARSPPTPGSRRPPSSAGSPRPSHIAVVEREAAGPGRHRRRALPRHPRRRALQEDWPRTIRSTSDRHRHPRRPRWRGIAPASSSRSAPRSTSPRTRARRRSRARYPTQELHLERDGLARRHHRQARPSRSSLGHPPLPRQDGQEASRVLD